MGGPEVRQIAIKGDAASAYLNNGKVRRNRSTRKAPNFSTRGGEARAHESAGLTRSPKQHGGADDLPPGPSLAGANNYRRAANISKSAEVVSLPSQRGGAAADVAATAAPIVRSMPGTVAQNPTHIETPAVKAQLEAGTAPPTADQKGGGPASPAKKVVLAPPKKKTRGKVLLAAPGAAAAPTKHKARGVQQTRKIRVQLSGLKKRLTKAKTIHKDSREKPIADVRKLLEEAKLIKPQAPGKALVPDAVLRDIYKDYLLLRNRAL